MIKLPAFRTTDDLNSPCAVFEVLLRERLQTEAYGVITDAHNFERGRMLDISIGPARAMLTLSGAKATINEIESRERARGNASQLLAIICDCADEAGVKLRLLVDPYTLAGMPVGLGDNALIAWYERYEFTLDDKGFVMAREPHDERAERRVAGGST